MTVRVYLACFFGVPLCLTASVLAIAGSDWFFAQERTFSLREMGYGASLRHADCQVVVSGDSSAMSGLDPQTLTRVTGMSACNVAEIGPVNAVSGTIPLDTYLRRNARPRYVVFMFTPGHFGPTKWADYGSPSEGMLYLMRFQRNWGTIQTLLAHPVDTINFGCWVTRSLLESPLARALHPHKHDGVEDPAAQRRRRRGLFTFDSPAQTACDVNDFKVVSTADAGWLKMLRARYGTNGTRVIVNVAPTPECHVARQAFEKYDQGLHDNALSRLPIGMFTDSDVHFTPEGAAHVSTELGQQILDLERLSSRNSQASLPLTPNAVQ